MIFIHLYIHEGTRKNRGKRDAWWIDCHTHTHTHTHIYIYIYIYRKKTSWRTRRTKTNKLDNQDGQQNLFEHRVGFIAPDTAMKPDGPWPEPIVKPIIRGTPTTGRGKHIIIFFRRSIVCMWPIAIFLCALWFMRVSVLGSQTHNIHVYEGCDLMFRNETRSYHFNIYI